MKRSSKIFLIFVISVLIIPPVLWICGLMWFRSIIGGLAIDQDTRTDVIVVLTGGSERLQEGVRLLQDGYADKVFVSGVGKKGTTQEELLSNKGYDLTIIELLKGRMEFGFDARDTVGNAEEVAEWLEGKEYTSIRLVTSNYHMPRSLFEFRKMLPSYKIIPHPVISPNVKLDEWWKYQNSRDLVITEYDKYLSVIIRDLLGLRLHNEVYAR